MQFNIKDAKHREKLLFEVMYYIMGMRYTDRKKFLHIPEEYITEGGYPLGRIWAELKEAYNQNILSEEEIRFLIKIKMQLTDSPQKKLEIWLDRADEVEEYYKAHGTLSMPSTILFRNGVSMFQWVHQQKKLYKQGELSSYQIMRLENMGIQWIKPKQVTGWNQGYGYAKQYFEENGHLFVHKKYITSDGFELGKWIWEQRERYLGLSKYEISDERIDMLEDIGMFWEDLKNSEWDWFVGLLRECIRVTKKPFVIGKSYRYKNYALGEKVRNVIEQYANGSLTAEQERELRQAGFKFNIHIK
ncbi:MAG: helicase associated domain-containing protein [Ruminococcus flavefaciens]|nr:helicase associated domain-containing protein [Ruminococcus flavefaciens]